MELRVAMSLYQGHPALVTHIWPDVVIHPPRARIMGSIVAIPGVLGSLYRLSFTPLARHAFTPLARHAYHPIFFLFPVIMPTAARLLIR
jgi:hypothetical protein